MRVEPNRGRDLRVGRYAIQGEIATGGMATVHVGRLLGPAGFSRSVAIKRLHPQYAKDPDFVAMFLDEARLASRILHPNVVPILDVVAESGELFLVMEFVAGEVLSKLWKRTPEGVPLKIAAAIAVGVLEGLHAAHEARSEDGRALDIVHRDVSPQNILLGLDGVARLIDFGIAKATGNSTATRDGQVKGKVAYMAPEQIRSEPVDRRADVYAASVVLWELLTGQRFFGEADSEAARMMRALSQDPIPPSRHRPELAPDIDAIVMRGLSRDPDARCSTAREMAQAIERVTTPAAARDVARWVEAKAGETLHAQAHRMSAFDLSIATELPGRPSPHVLADATAITLTQGSDIDGSRPNAGSRPAGRSKTPFFVGLAILAAGGIGFYAAKLGTPEVPAPSAPVLTDPTGKAAADAPVREVAPTAIPATVVPSAEASEAASPTSSASASGSPSASAAPVRSWRDRPPPAAKPNCSPNYTITADGLRKYKPECLK